MKIACLTDRGKARDNNEDSLVHQKIDSFTDLIIVADGMGGHNAGEIASSIAVKSIMNYILENKDGLLKHNEPEEIIKKAIIKANDDILHASVMDPHYSGMGTTATVALIHRDKVYFGHVGDSRGYILRNGKLTRITNDHSLVAELVKNGTITEAEAQHHPQKNIITRALGAENNVQVDTTAIDMDRNDIILLCSDGLTNLVDDAEIEEILNKYADPETATENLVQYANELGGYDNISVAVASAACSDDEVSQAEDSIKHSPSVNESFADGKVSHREVKE